MSDTTRDIIYILAGLIALRMITGALVNSAALSAQGQAAAAQSASSASQAQSSAYTTGAIAGDASGLLAAVINAGAQY
jgi:hypothetical protein